MRHLIMRFRNDQSAATAIEYGLIAAGISVAIIAVVLGIGTNLNTTFGDVSSALKEHPAATSSLEITSVGVEPTGWRAGGGPLVRAYLLRG
jgi:pilus assembly protein Flp/PilA